MNAARTTQKKAHEGDRPLLIIAGLLLFSGLTILASASVAVAQRDFGNGFYYVTKQVLYGGLLGIAFALIVQVIPIQLLKRSAIFVLGLTVILLLAVFVPGIGVGAGGAVRWIDLGPITVQPGEIARVALPWYLAAWFANRTLERKKQQEILMPFLLVVGIVALPLFLQPDLSTIGVLTITALAMFFLAGGSLRSIAVLIGGGLTVLLVVIRLAPYRMNRILAFLDPGSDPLGIGYQVNQALLAVGSGGLFGRGLGFSREKLFFLPEPMGDAIFAIFAEETGFIGASLLIGLFIALLWRGFVIVRKLDDPFMRLFTAGLITWIVVQAILNIAGNIALAPLVGVTLPFVSYGNASLAMTLLSVGLVYRFSRYTKLINN